MREDTLAIVQFMHPGKEQNRVKGGQCTWNSLSQSHRRKFLVNSADYLLKGMPATGAVGFWGEWEGPSFAREIGASGSDVLPQFAHFPAYYEPESSDGLRDTDPFVFGDRFLYNGCQQFMSDSGPSGVRETFLRRLDVGSVILFGSAIKKRFALDTVFVVSDYTDYPNGNFDLLEGLVPDEYYELTLKTQAAGNQHVKDSYRLYRGATYADPVNGMFSYTPCQKAKGRLGFPRPIIDLSCITQSMTQGKKMTALAEDGVLKMWQAVRDQVECYGLGLAHQIHLEPKLVRPCKGRKVKSTHDQEAQNNSKLRVMVPGWDESKGTGHTVERAWSKDIGDYLAIRAPGCDKAYTQSLPEASPIDFRADDIVADIGGFIGEFALRAAKAGVKRVVAFEPTPATYSVLRENLKPYANAEARHAAVVADGSESIELFLSVGNGTRNRIGDAKFQKRKDSVTVPTVQFEDAIKDATILKIDTEGAEWGYPIIENLQDQLRAICIEFHPGYYPRADDGSRVETEVHLAHTKRIIDKIESLGFKQVYPKTVESLWTRYDKHGLQWAVPATWMKVEA